MAVMPHQEFLLPSVWLHYICKRSSMMNSEPTPQRPRLKICLTILNLVLHFAFNAIATPMEITRGPERLMGTAEIARVSGPGEDDVLLKLLQVKFDTTPVENYDEIYMPSKVSPPRKITYDVTAPLVGMGRDPEPAQREYIFTHLIKAQLGPLKTKNLDKKLQARIRSLIRDTARRYIHPFEKTENLLSQKKPGLLSRIKLWFYRQRVVYNLTPSSTAILKDVKSEFQRAELPVAFRKELWTLMLYHAFHSPEAEDYLINLYRQDAFRKVLIDYLSKLYDFGGRDHGMSWPMHRSVLSEGVREAQGYPQYEDFFRFHGYLLKQKSNELMELLDRDVLISQLETQGLDPTLISGLKSLPRDWRYQENLEASNLAKLAIEQVEKMYPKKPTNFSSDGSERWDTELRGYLTVLLHLRAYGHQNINDLINVSKFITLQ